jgi:hypothetical protein
MKSDPKILKTAYASIFKGELGKIVMNDLKSWCHIDKTSFVPDSNTSAFNEGKRFIFLRICSMSNIDLDKLSQRDVETQRPSI